jgi:MFS family permease
VAGIPFALAFALSPDPTIALVCFASLTFFITLYMPPITSLSCDIVPAGMRATIIALIGLITIVAGQGFGTLLIGVLNDAYTPAFGEFAVRYSLVTISVNLLIGAVAAYLAGQAAARSAREAHA